VDKKKCGGRLSKKHTEEENSALQGLAGCSGKTAQVGVFWSDLLGTGLLPLAGGTYVLYLKLS